MTGAGWSPPDVPACSRFGATVFAAGAMMAACTTTPVPDAPGARDLTAERAACEAQPAPTAECLDILTRPQFESREQVEAAEAQREADAFRGRLAGLRAAEENRQRRRRVKTATAAVARLLGRPMRPMRAPPAERSRRPFGGRRDALDASLVDLADPTEVTAVDSAGEAAPPEGDPGLDGARPPRPARAVAPAETPVDSPPPGPALATGPTPELYLRAGRCLLRADHDAGLTALTVYRRGPSVDRERVGRWALALTDANALVARIEGEMVHRKLAKPGPVCTSSEVRPVVEVLRSLVGPAPSTLDRALVYGRGLARLDRELQIRAGLPRAE